MELVQRLKYAAAAQIFEGSVLVLHRILFFRIL